MAVGGANTLVTTAAFYGLALILPTRVAFTLVYAGGIVFNVLVTPSFVFGVSASVGRRVLLGLWYVTTYLAGIGLITLLGDVAGAPRIAVVVATVAVTAPLGFAGARLLVRRGQPVSSGAGSGRIPGG